MKIAALIPLILAIYNSVDILNFIPNVEEHNLEFLDELNIAMYRRTRIKTATRWDSNSILTNWSPNSQLVELVEGNTQLVELVEYFKNVFKKINWVTIQLKFQAYIFMRN